MVTQHHRRRISQTHYEAQYLGGFRAPVDQVTRKPQVILRGIELEGIQQHPQLLIAPLDIADCEHGHGLVRISRRTEPNFRNIF